MRVDPSSRRNPTAARLVIADDHELARAGLRTMLTGQRGLELIGEATNGREALALCRRLQPDLVLLDVRMPEMDGLAACYNIKRVCPAIRVILLTMHENPEYLREALKAGASDYVLKDISQRELIATVKRSLHGQSFLNRELVIRLLGHGEGETHLPVALLHKQLSSREQEVLQLLTQGQTNPEIARNLNISVSTVKIHVEHILAKLDVSDRTQAAVKATELGLLHSSAK